MNLEVTALTQRKAGDGLPGEVVEDEEDVFRAAISLRNSCLSEENMAKGNGILKKRHLLATFPGLVLLAVWQL